MDEFDDILGGGNPVKRPVGRPKGSFTSQRSLERNRAAAQAELATSLSNVHGGVSIDWLSKAFGMARAQVVSALRQCPVYRRHQNGGVYYDLKTAAGYLVKPERELAEFIRTIKSDDLPEKMRESYWNAKTKEMKYRLLAGELWPTESVMEIFSDTFQLIANKSKLWVDDLEEETELTDKQRTLLLKMVDDLMSELREALIERARSQQTASYVEDLDE